MNTRYVLLLLLAASIGAIALATACGGGSKQTTASRATIAPTALGPSRTESIVATTLQDAVRLSASFYTGHGSTLSSARADRVQYIQTTAGQAESFFNRDPNWNDVPAQTRVWVFVAYGEFQVHSMGVADTFQPPSTTAWVVVPDCCPQNGSPHAALWGYSTTTYDLSQMGTAVDLPPSAYAHR